MRTSRPLIVLVALAGTAGAQSVMYRTQFDDATGWTLDLPASGEPGWQVDGLPAFAPAGAYRSAPSSLNYNDDHDYEGSTNGRHALSPQIDLAAATGIPVLTFWCNNESQEGTCDAVHERCHVYAQGVGLGGFDLCFAWSDAPFTCASGAWHRHVAVMDRSWGKRRIAFEVNHDTVSNATAGWFFDDLEILDWPVPATYCTAKANSLGCTPRIATSGTPSLSSGGSFRVRGLQVLNNKAGTLVYSLAGPAAIPFQGGTLCLASPRRRTPLQSSAGSPPPNDCSGVFSFEFLAWARSGVDPALVEGAQVFAQYWYRDGGASFDTGLTDAVQFTLIP